MTAVSKSSFKKAKNYADFATDDINLLAFCDVVFVCSKMSDTKNVLEKLENILPAKTIVTDVCSIKSFLDKEYKFNYIPSHPMAGTEFSGFENSYETLFDGAKWIIGRNSEILESIICDLGAKPILMKMALHDDFTAQISHFPMLFSMALFNSADDSAKKIASSGFRDTTRLAMTNVDLAFDMVKFNKTNILKEYEKFCAEFERIINLKENDFKKTIQYIAQKRQKMYDKNGKNIL